MSGPWKPNLFQGQNLANQIEENLRERAAEQQAALASNVSTPSPRYQPIAPYGNIPPTNSLQKRRTGRACDECRRKKIKCYASEDSTSCKNCISYRKGYTYNTGVKKRGPPRGYINVLENRLKRIEGLIDTMSNNTNNATSSSPPSATTISNEDDSHAEGSSDDPNSNQLEENFKPTIKYMLDAIRDSYLTAEGRFISGNSVGYILSRSVKMLSTSELRRFGVDIQHNKNSDYFHIKKAGSSDDKRRDQILQLIDLGVIGTADAINNIDDWIWKVAGIRKDLSDRLLKVYFAYIHPLFPVINKVAFLEEYRGIRTYYPSGPLLNAVYGASVRYVENCKRFGDESLLDDDDKSWEFPEKLAQMLFQNLIIFIKGKYSPCLSIIQAIVIAHNHSANVESWTSGWLLNCIAVRMAQDIGLHRSSDGWNITQQEKETRRMVWWQVYLLDRWFSAGTGRPLTAFDEDCDELYPSENVSLDEIMDTMTEQDRHLPRFPSLDKRVAARAPEDTIPMNQPFMQLLKLSEILGRLLQGLYTPKAKRHSAKHGSDAIVAYLDDALSKWRASLPPLLEISSNCRSNTETEGYVPLLSMSGLVCVSYSTLLILLHRPFIEKDSNGCDAAIGSTDEDTANKKPKLSSQTALTICTSAAIRIIDVSENMHYRDFLMVSWGFALYPVFTAALIHVYNSSNPDSIISDVAKSNLIRALAVVDKLCLLSPMAENMANILKKVIALSSIFVDDPDFVSLIQIKKNLTGESTETPFSSLSTTTTTAIDPNPMSTGEQALPYGKGKGKGTGKRQHSEWTPVDDKTLRTQWFTDNQHINKKRAVNTTPSWDNVDWLNRLYAPIQSNLENDGNKTNDNDSSTAVSASLSGAENSLPERQNAFSYTAYELYRQQLNERPSNVDAYSIRQFGFNMFNPNTQQQSNSTQIKSSLSNTTSHRKSNNAAAPTLTQESTNAPYQGHINDTAPVPNPVPMSQPTNYKRDIPLPPDVVFGFSDFSYPFFCGTSISASTNSMPSTTGHNFNSNGGYPFSNDMNILDNTLLPNDNDPSTFFRHRPDNPFWDMPSSMEMEDWHAYLLPHQQQFQQQQQQQRKGV